jgi:hypothetical protein
MIAMASEMVGWLQRQEERETEDGHWRRDASYIRGGGKEVGDERGLFVGGERDCGREEKSNLWLLV